MAPRIILSALASCLIFGIASLPADAAAPNILWITAEDMSATLGCYGDAYAVTPNIDRLAIESVRYTHAFASAPVCSPSRSCLITGCYATSLGTHNMRSAFSIPDSMRGFPALLRDAGWFTTNNMKTDYNTSSGERIVKASWDESSATAHWRRRPEAKRDQPFFCVFNLMTTHQSRSMVWPREQFEKEVQSKLTPAEIHDPAKAPLPPYYPDTPIIRRTVARYYDCVTAMDKEVGAILQQLEEDGLADETIVFFYSDHGSGMPRHKRALLDSGMHVPLLIRFPQKYQDLAPAEISSGGFQPPRQREQQSAFASAGKTTDRLVSFVDFGPTVLSLAGIEVPKQMQGRPFLGAQNSAPREYVFGHRDRVDEVIDLARSVRDKRYLYIRNYMPHLGYNQPSAWPDQGEIRHEFYRLTDPNKMTAAQWQFAGPTRPVEELYDCENDPLNLHNLVRSPEHFEVLERLRKAHQDHAIKSNDVGFIPEPLMWEIYEDKPPWEAVRGWRINKHLAAFEAASAVGVAEEAALLRMTDYASSAWRYWGAIGLAGRETLSARAKKRLVPLLNDSSPAVQIAAADALGRYGEAERAVPVLIELLQHKDLTVVLHAARTIELLGSAANSAAPAMRELLARTEKMQPTSTQATYVLTRDQDLAMFAGFAAGGFLSRVEKKD